jgi:hypothetical protein
MKKIAFEGKDSTLFIFQNENGIELEMIECGVSLQDLQIGDSYNALSLTKEQAVDLANEILKLSKDGNE